MFWTLLYKSVRVNWKGKLLAVATIAFGAALITAMLNVSLDVGDKMNKELKTYGSNLKVVPITETIPLPGARSSGYINEEEIPKLKMIFWRHNIVAFAPYLEADAQLRGETVSLLGTWFDKKIVIPTGETVQTGVKDLKAWWKVDGEWPREKALVPQALVVDALAGKHGIKIGDEIILAGSNGKNLTAKVSGILSTGEEETAQILLPLDIVQGWLGLENKVNYLEVSALTTPDNELAQKARSDINSLTAEEFERWYCTAYVDSIAYQIEEAIHGVKAKVIRQVAQSEGIILRKIQVLMLLLTLAAVVGAALGTSSLFSAGVLERSQEIGLLKALGATNSDVTRLFLAEAVLTGLAGGLGGYGLGLGMAAFITWTVFASAMNVKTLVFPVTLILATGIALLGSLSAVRSIVSLSPREVLHGR